MINDDPMYVRQLEAARDAAEIEIKALEDELKRCHEIISEQQNDLNPTHMGEPKIDEDGNRWRWITRAGRTRELRIPATEGKKSIDAAIDNQRLIKTHNAEFRPTHAASSREVAPGTQGYAPKEKT